MDINRMKTTKLHLLLYLRDSKSPIMLMDEGSKELTLNLYMVKRVPNTRLLDMIIATLNRALKPLLLYYVFTRISSSD